MKILYNYRVTINISGEIFETFLETLERYPTTVLGSKRKRLPFFCHRTSQYFFQRNRGCFDSILFFYQSKGEICHFFNHYEIKLGQNCPYPFLPWLIFPWPNLSCPSFLGQNFLCPFFFCEKLPWPFFVECFTLATIVLLWPFSPRFHPDQSFRLT